MRIKTIVLIAVVVVIVALGVWWKGFHRAGSEAGVRIGVLLPLSGDAAAWGVSMKEGIDLALDERNEKRGQGKLAVGLSYEDDRGSPRDGLSAIQKLADADQVKALLGVANSSVALAVIPVINERHILFVSGGASSPKLSGASRYFFRTWPSDLAEAVAMAHYIKDKGTESVGLLYINNEYGVGLRDPFKSNFEQLGGKIASEQTFPQEATDFRGALLAIQKGAPQAIYLVGNPREMARCLKQAKDMGIKTAFFSTSAFRDPEVLKIAGTAADGVVFTDASFDPNSPYPETREFIRRFHSKYGRDPGMLAVTGYDSFRVMTQALDQANNDNEAAAGIIRNMRSFPGAAGPISFNSDGDVSRPVRISTVADGQFVTKEYIK